MKTHEAVEYVRARNGGKIHEMTVDMFRLLKKHNPADWEFVGYGRGGDENKRRSPDSVEVKTA